MMLLDMARSVHPDRVAIGPRDGGLTVEELHARAGTAARQLRGGDTRALAYVGTNSAAFAVCVFAAAWAGIPVMPINYRLSTAQITKVLDQHDDVLVVAESAVAARLETRHRVADRDAWLARTGSGPQAEGWNDDAEAVAVLLHTSGTTSEPKAAVLRHRHLMSYVLGSVEFDSAEETDAALVTVPPYHVAGLANMVSNLYAGRRLVYRESFTADGWLDTVRHEGVTHAMVVPTMLARIVTHLGDAPHAQAPTLRTLAYGGSRTAPSVVEQALRLFPQTDFVNAYGLTETSSTIAVLGPEDHRAALAAGDESALRRLGSVGRLIPGIEAEVRGPDGTVLPPGHPGDLFLRGPQISGEYVRHASPVDADGWFPTRDRAHFDEDGYLYVGGRSDDTIIRGGENTSPAEIEEVLLSHPAVVDAAVVGLADVEWGQRIAAVVVLAEGQEVKPDALRTFTRGFLRSSKTPDQIDFWPELPYTDTGKLLRRQVLDRLETGHAL